MGNAATTIAMKFAILAGSAVLEVFKDRDSSHSIEDLKRNSTVIRKRTLVMHILLLNGITNQRYVLAGDIAAFVAYPILEEHSNLTTDRCPLNLGSVTLLDEPCIYTSHKTLKPILLNTSVIT
jgi:hypothetical protein